MTDRAEVSAVLRSAVQEVMPAPGLLDRVRDGGRRRRLRRRVAAAAAGVATGTMVTAVAVIMSGPGGVTIATVPGTPSTASTSRAALGAPVPALVGLTMGSSELEARLSGYQSRVSSADGIPVPRDKVFVFQHLARNDAPVGRVVEQVPAAGIGWDRSKGPIVVRISAGGPAVPVSAVPAAAAALLKGRLLDGEEVLVLQTAAGPAYKIDAVLVGPCAAVRLAYRTVPDGRYDDECY